MDERDLRNALRDHAARFEMDPAASPEILRRAGRRIAARVAIGTAITTLVVAAASLIAGGGLSQPRGPDVGRRGRTVPIELELVDYYKSDGNKADSGPSRQEIDQHIDCMREQGFDLPAPTRTNDRWMVFVEDPQRLDIGSARWREAAFVECSPPEPPGPGDLIMPGVPEPRIDRFRDCIRAEGFELPAPHLEKGVWRFDMSGPGADFGDPDWRRAVFVSCPLEGEDF
jgi:hypothetical protein